MWGWIIFIFIDPIPTFLFLLFFGKCYLGWIMRVDPDSYMRYIFNIQYWLYGPVCAIWWYYLPRFLMPKRLGGVWGKLNTCD